MLLPPLGEGWDGGSHCQLCHAVINRLNHTSQIRKRQIGGETNDCESMAFKKLIAFFVIRLLITVLRPVNLNHQQRREARKICDVSAQRMLTPKLNAQLFHAKLLPKQTFAVGHVPAK